MAKSDEYCQKDVQRILRERSMEALDGGACMDDIVLAPTDVCSERLQVAPAVVTSGFSSAPTRPYFSS